MGILSGVVKAILPTKAKINNVGAVLNAAFNPLSKDKVVANVKNPTIKKSLELVANNPYVSAGVVAGGLNPSFTAKSISKVAAPVARTLMPKTAKGAILLGGGSIIAAGIIKENPKGAVSLVSKSPSELLQFGSDIGKFTKDPSISTGKDIISNSPILSLATGGLLAGGTIVSGVNAYGNYLNREATKENTEALLNGVSSAVYSDTPMTPATATIQEVSSGLSKSSTKKKYARKKAVMPSISNKVNVVISNKATSTGVKATSKRYIKEYGFAR